VNFPSTDIKGHSGVWADYLEALTLADSLIYKLWLTIQQDSVYKDQISLFITNDHGRHTDKFKDHGDGCDGCEHIMLLAVGKNIPASQKNFELHHQIDIAVAIGELLQFQTPLAEGIGLINDNNSNSIIK
jgi:bisphosphoglycerate-independent phosphoglycerate mutase (AlkP superfamily)